VNQLKSAAILPRARRLKTSRTLDGVQYVNAFKLFALFVRDAILFRLAAKILLTSVDALTIKARLVRTLATAIVMAEVRQWLQLATLLTNLGVQRYSYLLVVYLSQPSPCECK
jgi:hypothetical protein